MVATKQTDILLAAFNARYSHCALGARWLLANLGPLRKQAELMEFDLSVQSRAAVEQILARNPRIVGIGCYIWNIDLVTQVSAQLKVVRPDIRLILGGPEISYETEEQPVFQHADYVICGEGELEFRKLCTRILKNGDKKPSKIIHAEPVDIEALKLPYKLYSDEDIAHRAIYVEASRGCPFRCEYCMSSLDPCVRYFPEDTLQLALEELLNRGARVFRFTDRTFNLDPERAIRLLSFFRERYVPDMMVHFEAVPEYLPETLLEAVRQCPPGMLQFEVGIQTLNETVARRIKRPLQMQTIETNLRRLRQETHVHIHADLIAGLPGEDLNSFANGFDRLLTLEPHEIQLGILKRLRGAPIDRHTYDWNMVYSPHAPYEILQNRSVSFEEMQRINRFARYWNLVVNNGRFPHTSPLLWRPPLPEQGRQDVGDTSAPPAHVPPASSGPRTSAFAAFMEFSDWLYAETGTTGNLHAIRLAQLLLQFLTKEKQQNEGAVAEALWQDHQLSNRPDVPGFLKKYGFKRTGEVRAETRTLPPRQRRHLKE